MSVNLADLDRLVSLMSEPWFIAFCAASKAAYDNGAVLMKPPEPPKVPRPPVTFTEKLEAAGFLISHSELDRVPCRTVIDALASVGYPMAGVKVGLELSALGVTSKVTTIAHKSVRCYIGIQQIED